MNRIEPHLSNYIINGQCSHFFHTCTSDRILNISKDRSRTSNEIKIYYLNTVTSRGFTILSMSTCPLREKIYELSESKKKKTSLEMDLSIFLRFKQSRRVWTKLLLLMLLAGDIILFLVYSGAKNQLLPVPSFSPPCQIKLAVRAKRKTNIRHHDTMTLDPLWQSNVIVFPTPISAYPHPKRQHKRNSLTISHSHQRERRPWPAIKHSYMAFARAGAAA